MWYVFLFTPYLPHYSLIFIASAFVLQGHSLLFAALLNNRIPSCVSLVTPNPFS